MWLTFSHDVIGRLWLWMVISWVSTNDCYLQVVWLIFWLMLLCRLRQSVCVCMCACVCVCVCVRVCVEENEFYCIKKPGTLISSSFTTRPGADIMSPGLVQDGTHCGDGMVRYFISVAMTVWHHWAPVLRHCFFSHSYVTCETALQSTNSATFKPAVATMDRCALGMEWV